MCKCCVVINATMMLKNELVTEKSKKFKDNWFKTMTEIALKYDYCNNVFIS